MSTSPERMEREPADVPNTERIRCTVPRGLQTRSVFVNDLKPLKRKQLV